MNKKTNLESINMTQNNQPGMQTPSPAAQPTMTPLPVAQPTMTPIPALQYGHDPRSTGQYAVDKTLEAFGKGLDRMEKEKPGTRRKLAGIASLTIGVGGLGAGIFLLTT